MKTHYRKVFKSDHLSSYDLEDFEEQGRPLEFTIKEVRQEMNTKVAGRKIDANVCYFVEHGIKPLVLNATNSKIVSKLAGSPFVENWKNISIEVYIQKGITFGKETVQGIRVKEKSPELITEKDIKVIQGKVIVCETQQALNVFYNSLSAKEKTNKEVIQILKNRQEDLKQV